MSFGSTLDPIDYLVIFSSMMHYEKQEEAYAHYFSPTTVPRKVCEVTHGAQVVEQKHSASDEGAVKQIPEKCKQGVLAGLI